MTTDIIQRLRAGPLSGDPVFEEAADEIERLRTDLRAYELTAQRLSESENEEIARLRKLYAEEGRKALVLQEEASALRDACRQAGVCMTCVIRAPEPYGCTDCMNTGWVGGAPFGKPVAWRWQFPAGTWRYSSGSNRPALSDLASELMPLFAVISAKG